MLLIGVLFLLIPVALVVGAIVAAVMETKRHEWRFEISNIASNTFSAIGGAPLVMLGTSLLVSAAPQAVLEFALGRSPGLTPTAAIFDMPGLWVANVLVWLLLGQFGQLVMVRTALGVLTGTREPFRDTIARALRMLALAVAVAIAAWVGIFGGALLFLFPGVMLFVAWIVVLPVLAAENVSFTECFARSGSLTKGARWRIFLLLVLTGIAYMMAGGVIGVMAVAGGTTGAVIVQLVVGTLGGAIGAAGTAAIYHELRSRKEGLLDGELEAVFA